MNTEQKPILMYMHGIDLRTSSDELRLAEIDHLKKELKSAKAKLRAERKNHEAAKREIIRLSNELQQAKLLLRKKEGEG